MLEAIQNHISESEYEDWEWYFLIFSGGMFLATFYDFRLITDFLYALDRTHVTNSYTTGEVVLSALEGIVMSILGGHLYSQGDTYFAAITESYNSKETAFLIRIGLITCLGLAVGLFIPEYIYENAEFVVVQSFGGVVLLGYFLIHEEIVGWRLSNEMPVLVAGFLLIAGPMF